MRSILMDAVSKEERARWNALETVTAVGWSGSALLGGFLADKYGCECVIVCCFFLLQVSSCVSINGTNTARDS
jgi:hypothetical protein